MEESIPDPPLIEPPPDILPPDMLPPDMLPLDMLPPDMLPPDILPADMLPPDIPPPAIPPPPMPPPLANARLLKESAATAVISTRALCLFIFDFLLELFVFLKEVFHVLCQNYPWL
jgi:hypothetical protein